MYQALIGRFLSKDPLQGINPDEPILVTPMEQIRENSRRRYEEAKRRQYDAQIRQFLQPNAYVYADNNPATKSDPSGLEPEDADWKARMEQWTKAFDKEWIRRRYKQSQSNAHPHSYRDAFGRETIATVPRYRDGRVVGSMGTARWGTGSEAEKEPDPESPLEMFEHTLETGATRFLTTVWDGLKELGGSVVDLNEMSTETVVRLIAITSDKLGITRNAGASVPRWESISQAGKFDPSRGAFEQGMERGGDFLKAASTIEYWQSLDAYLKTPSDENAARLQSSSTAWLQFVGLRGRAGITVVESVRTMRAAKFTPLEIRMTLRNLGPRGASQWAKWSVEEPSFGRLLKMQEYIKKAREELREIDPELERQLSDEQIVKRRLDAESLWDATEIANPEKSTTSEQAPHAARPKVRGVEVPELTIADSTTMVRQAGKLLAEKTQGWEAADKAAFWQELAKQIEAQHAPAWTGSELLRGTQGEYVFSGGNFNVHGLVIDKIGNVFVIGKDVNVSFNKFPDLTVSVTPKPPLSPKTAP